MAITLKKDPSPATSESDGSVIRTDEWNKLVDILSGTDSDKIVSGALETVISSKTINLSNNTLEDTSDTQGDLIKHNGTKFVRFADGNDGQVLKSTGSDLAWEDDIAEITMIIDGGGSAITTGIKGDIQIDFDCTILQATMLADQSGSIVVDIWKNTYANFPATNANSITASAIPTISSTTKSQDTTLTGWTTAITAEDHLRFNVDSATSIQRVTVALKVKKT